MFYKDELDAAKVDLFLANDQLEEEAERFNQTGADLYQQLKRGERILESCWEFYKSDNTVFNADFHTAEAEYVDPGASCKGAARTLTGMGAAVGLGALGGSCAPAAVMAAVTTFGTASTGVAISSLSGAAATNAALAAIGGGTIAAGGGGMAAGSAILASLGPIGVGLGIISAVAIGVGTSRKNLSDADEARGWTVILENKTRFLAEKRQTMENLVHRLDECRNLIKPSLFYLRGMKEYRQADCRFQQYAYLDEIEQNTLARDISKMERIMREILDFLNSLPK